MSISVIIPAYNEELYIANTLGAILAARDYLQAAAECPVEIMVVNNSSTDRTASIAHDLGMIVLDENTHNVACVRNRGAKSASGDVLVFVDADTLIPEPILLRIHELTSDGQCLGAQQTLFIRPNARAWLYTCGCGGFWANSLIWRRAHSSFAEKTYML